MGYCVRYVALPCTIKGVTVEDGEGFYSIYINAVLSADEQGKALNHELRHLKREDFDNTKSLQRAESN